VNSYFRSILAGLRHRGFLRLTDDGYVRPGEW